jgi:hypothetical protein
MLGLLQLRMLLHAHWGCQMSFQLPQLVQSARLQQTLSEQAMHTLHLTVLPHSAASTAASVIP